nr:LuxR C-terminal-related transcriptional regulator [Micromonospora sp. DSM 115978]
AGTTQKEHGRVSNTAANRRQCRSVRRPGPLDAVRQSSGPAPLGSPATGNSLDGIPPEKLRGMFLFGEDVWASNGLEMLSGTVLRSLAYRLGFHDGIVVVGVEQGAGVTSHHAVGTGLGSRVASELTVVRECVPPNPATGRSAAEDPLRELELLDETLRDNEVGDRLAYSLPAPPGVCVLLALLARPGQRFGQVDRSVFAAMAPQLDRIFRLHVTMNPDLTKLSLLTPREQEVARAIAKGYSNAEVARALKLSLDSVKHHATTAMRVTGCRNRTQLALLWHRSTGSLLPSADIAGQRNPRTRTPSVS